MLLKIPFGEYLLFKRIAKGGMAEVYLAGKNGPGSFDKLVALKTILRQRNDDASFIQMFYNEARLTARFKHPNLITVYDVSVIDNKLTMVMEYVPGATVADLVKKAAERGEPFPRQVAIRIVLDSCRGLYHAHHLTDYDGTPLDLVHRDVSPQNILVGYNGQVKVFDFGIARTANGVGDDNLAGVLAGKYAYMSPEQTQGGELDERSDVFSLGIILYELTTQRRLFKRLNQIEVLRAITEEPIQPPSELIPGFPRKLDRVVMTALERDPANRPATALELHDILAAYANVAGENMSMEALGDYVGRVLAPEIEEERAFLKAGFEYLRQLDLTREESAGEEGADLAKSGETSAPSELEVAPDTDDRAAELRHLAARSVSVSADRQANAPSVSELFPSVPDDLYRDLGRARRLNVGLALIILVLVAGGLAAFLGFTIQGDQNGGRVLLTEGQGQVTIATEPPGATIFIQGVQRAEITPATVMVPADGPVEIEVRKSGYESASTVVTANETQPVHHLQFVLQRSIEQTDQRGAIRVVTVPPEAAVFVDDTYRGLSPATVENLLLGVNHTLRVQMVGYETREIEFTLSTSRTREFQLELREQVALGSLTVLTQPSGAQLKIDGEVVGVTPIERFPLVSARDFAIELELEGYRPYNTTVRVEPDSETVVDQRLAHLRYRNPGRIDRDREEGSRSEEESQPSDETEETPAIRPLEEDQGEPEEENPYDLL